MLDSYIEISKVQSQSARELLHKDTVMPNTLHVLEINQLHVLLKKLITNSKVSKDTSENFRQKHFSHFKSDVMTYSQLNTDSSFSDQDMNEYWCDWLWNGKGLYGLMQVTRNPPLKKQNKSTPLVQAQQREQKQVKCIGKAKTTKKNSRLA